MNERKKYGIMISSGMKSLKVRGDNDMNILYLINFAGKAGTEKYVENLIEAYNGKKANCFFCYSIHGPLADKMIEKNIPYIRISMKNPFDLIAAKKLASYCKKNKIDVICPQYPRENAIAILSRIFYPKAKVVFTSHLTIRCNIIWKIINKLYTPHNHRIISVCSHGKELLIKNGFPAKKIDVIYNAIRADVTKKSSTIREELGLTDEFIIFIMARYHFSKGLPFLLESINKLKKMTDKPFKLVIAGDGDDRALISQRIKELNLSDYVIELGFRKDTENILAGADLYVNSSSCLEALSFAILEALAKGLPVVATTAGGNTDIVNPETDLGIAVPYGDTTGFAKAICDIMSDEEMYNRMSKNAIRAVEGKFGYDRMLSKTFETYN